MGKRSKKIELDLPDLGSISPFSILPEDFEFRGALGDTDPCAKCAGQGLVGENVCKECRGFGVILTYAGAAKNARARLWAVHRKAEMERLGITGSEFDEAVDAARRSEERELEAMWREEERADRRKDDDDRIEELRFDADGLPVSARRSRRRRRDA